MVQPLVIVGEANPYGIDPQFALYHLPRRASGNRLRVILGLSDVDYERIRKVNLCPGKWVRRDALVNAARLYAEMWDASGCILALGAKVKEALKAPEFFTSRWDGGMQIATLPHPSGLNRMWDVPGSVERARRLWQSLTFAS